MASPQAVSACVPSCNCPASVRCTVLNTVRCAQRDFIRPRSAGPDLRIVSALELQPGMRSDHHINDSRLNTARLRWCKLKKSFGGDEIPERRKVCGRRASKQMLKHYSHIRWKPSGPSSNPSCVRRPRRRIRWNRNGVARQHPRLCSRLKGSTHKNYGCVRRARCPLSDAEVYARPEPGKYLGGFGLFAMRVRSSAMRPPLGSSSCVPVMGAFHQTRKFFIRGTGPGEWRPTPPAFVSMAAT